MLVGFTRDSSVDIWERVDCPMCGPSETKMFLEKTPYRLVRCNQCSLVFMNPRLHSLGEHGLDTEERLEFLVKEHQRVRNLWCQEWLSWVQRYTTQGRLLDIGCSAGFFLSIARENGWDVTGIEPSEIMAQYGREVLGVPIIVGRLDNNLVDSFELKSYDVLTMWEVLEHLPNPSEGLEICKKLLKPGGMIFVQVPNIESPIFKLFRSRWHNLSIYNHVSFFSPNVLRALLERCGYDVKKVFTYSHIYRQVGKWKFRGIPLDSSSRFVRAITMVLNDWLMRITRTGDQIVAVARKSA